MKKYISVILCVFIICSLVGCGHTQTNKTTDKLSIVTTIFPIYDWVRQTVGEENSADVTMLLDKGVDLHSYQPSADDIIKLSNCDLFIYVGGESDEWAHDAIEQAANKSMRVINLLEALGETAKQEEIVDGMQSEEEHEHEHEHDEEVEYDEHIWLSLRNAKALCRVICDTLIQLDSENSNAYSTNYQAYCQKLDELDEAYSQTVNNAKSKTLIFGDRFPFRYLADDYGLKYFAAFPGCSAETEASFETIIFLANKLNEFKLSSVMKLEKNDGKIAQAIIDTSKASDCKILSLDSMQSVTSSDVKNASTYLSIMEKNLEVLKEALE